MLVVECIVHNAMELWEEALWGGRGGEGRGGEEQVHKLNTLLQREVSVVLC